MCLFLFAVCCLSLCVAVWCCLLLLCVDVVCCCVLLLFGVAYGVLFVVVRCCLLEFDVGGC